MSWDKSLTAYFLNASLNFEYVKYKTFQMWGNIDLQKVFYNPLLSPGFKKNHFGPSIYVYITFVLQPWIEGAEMSKIRFNLFQHWS